MVVYRAGFQAALLSDKAINLGQDALYSTNVGSPARVLFARVRYLLILADSHGRQHLYDTIGRRRLRSVRSWGLRSNIERADVSLPGKCPPVRYNMIS